MTILQHCMYLTRLTVFITVIKLEVVGKGTQVCAQLYIHLQNKNFTNVFGCIEALSEAVKVLKAEYLVKAITAHKMDQAMALLSH